MIIKRILPLLAAAVLMAPAGIHARQATDVVGVAFYNLENLFDTIPNNPYGRDLEYTPQGKNQWNTVKYNNKINKLAQAISSFTSKATKKGPAIIGVSEVENEQVLLDLVSDPQLRPWNLQVCHHDSPDKRGIDVALLYNPSMFKVENVTNHVVTEIPYQTRSQMCVVGRLKGQRVGVIVNHWPSRLGGEEQTSQYREAAARNCLAIADSLWKIDPNTGVIIMGDLNDDPQNKSTAQVLGAQKDPENVGPHQFYNPWWRILEKGIGTLAYKSSWNLFDQIIFSGNLIKADYNGPDPRITPWEFWRAEVLNFEFLKDPEGTRQGYPLRTFASGAYLNGYSDHFPTEIFLTRKVNL